MFWVVLGQVVVHVVQPLSPGVHLDAPVVLESRVDALRKCRTLFVVIPITRHKHQHTPRVEDLACSLQYLCVQRVVYKMLLAGSLVGSDGVAELLPCDFRALALKLPNDLALPDVSAPLDTAHQPADVELLPRCLEGTDGNV